MLILRAVVRLKVEMDVGAVDVVQQLELVLQILTDVVRLGAGDGRGGYR